MAEGRFYQMHISKVELENFKSHENAAFEFGRGTTAITGENGAGKTSIIEAIAWTVFNTLDYKKEDIVRRGAKKGSVRVTFESGLDEREYTVYRDTGAGYYIYDPQLRTRIADKKEEVTRFLWQHLGIEPGTDLDLLFRHAIGVPQGTFTAIFLTTAAERKKTFDTLLKVEEYRRSADELLKTIRFVEQRIGDVNIKIARSEGEIARIDVLEQELHSVKMQVGELSGSLERSEVEIEAKTDVVAKLGLAESRLNELNAVTERSRAEVVRAELELKHCKSNADRSREAVHLVSKSKPGADVHLETLGRIKELERERGERQKLRDELAGTEAALNSVLSERKHVELDIEKTQKALSEIVSLRQSVPDQDRLENEIAVKRSETAKAENAAEQLKVLDENLKRLREAYRRASEQLAAAREKGAPASQAEILRAREAEIVRELATVSAALERDERFQKEIKNGLCPILSERCLNLKDGQTLDGFVSSQFGEMRTRIDGLAVERSQVGNALKEAREAEKFSAQISVLESRVNEISEDGTRLNGQKADLEQEAEKLAAINAELKQLETELRGLDNPKARISLLETEARREGELRERASEAEKNLERLESDRRITIEKLEGYKDLDRLRAEADDTSESTAAAYRTYLANEGAAALAAGHERAFEAADKELKSANAELDSAVRNSDVAEKAYDRELHNIEKTALTDLQRKQAETRVSLAVASRRESELTSEADRLYEIRRGLQTEFRERERLQKIAEMTDFIRSTLKEAAPLVARNYVHHVSLEANQMFREIRGDAECTLKWSEDYGIVLEEFGHDRPFQSLSGGEQMAAALSVRLALLKQLTDIHIAFFDEPTTNMDAERRENLAQQIGRISHFDQLFVISHDDTFEGYMDHELRVGA